MSSVSFLPTIVDNPVTGEVLTYDGTANPPRWYNGTAGGSGASVAAPFVTHAVGGGLTNARLLSNGDGTTATIGLNPGDPAQIDWDAHLTDFITTSSITGVPNARVLTAGTGITLSTTTPGQLGISSTGNTTATYVTTGAETPSPLPNSSQLVNGDGTTVSAPAANQVTFDWDAYNTEILTASGTTGLGAGRVLTAGANITLTPTAGVLTISATGAGAIAYWVEATGTYSGKNWSSWTPNAVAPADAIILPAGTGAILADVPDGAATGGNNRGTYSIDLQIVRALNTQVASGNNSVLIGGQNSTASGASSTAIGGSGCIASGANSVAMGGLTPTASGTRSTAIGGVNALASGLRSAVVGGNTCQALADDTGCFAGQLNQCFAAQCCIAGGGANDCGVGGLGTNGGAFIGGGATCTTSGQYCAICGGSLNNASGQYSFIGGGQRNSTTALGSAVVGGIRTNAGLTNNQATASSAAVIGGRINLASGAQAAVIGGTNCQATGTGSISLGGERGDAVETSLNNQATGASSIVACGYQNLASGAQSGVFAGFQNTASGITSTAIGGITQTVSGNYSIAASNQGTIAVTNNNSVIMGNTGTINFNDPGILALCSATPTVSAANAIVIGSDTGTVSGARAILIGGTQSTGVAQSTGADSVAIGGKRPRATGANSACIGGLQCTAGGTESFTLGGNINTTGSTAVHSGIIGGFSNTNNASSSAIVGSSLTTIDSTSDTCIIAASNNACSIANCNNSALVGCDSTTSIADSDDSAIIASAASAINTTATGCAILAGQGCQISSVQNCFVSGLNTSIASGSNSVAIGTRNLGGTIGGQVRLFTVGIGAGVGVNGFSVDANGLCRAPGGFSTAAADFAEYMENSIEAVIPLGTTVVIEADGRGLIRPAKRGEIPIGVISNSYSFLGNEAEAQWHKMLLLGKNGRPLTKQYQETGKNGKVFHYEAVVINPEWDPKKKYIPRSQRPEWSIVGFVGQCKILPGQPVDSRWVYMKNVEEDGKAYELYLIR